MVGIIGQAITPFVALGLVPNFTIGWRLLFAIGAVIGAVGVVFGLRLPESPRWLIDQGRLEEAEVLIGSMESRFSPHERTTPEAQEEPKPLAADESQLSATRELLRGRHTRTVARSRTSGSDLGRIERLPHGRGAAGDVDPPLQARTLSRCRGDGTARDRRRGALRREVAA